MARPSTSSDAIARSARTWLRASLRPRLQTWASLLKHHPATALGPWWRCPACGWTGPFLPFNSRPYSRCPWCGALERHRLQLLVLLTIWPPTGVDVVVHASPEPAIAAFLAATARRYVTLDRESSGVGLLADLRALPYRNNALGAVYASHVLEHIADDRAAIAEIFRVLRPGGFGVLPVPIIAQRTVEYSAPRPEEHGHVRAPGPDYFDRLRDAGFEVEVFTSSRFASTRQQIRVYSEAGGEPSEDYVPVCRKPSS